MDLGLTDHVIVVTGGASGIGAAITRACVAEGARVVVLSRVSAGVEAFVAEMQASQFPVDLRVTELGDAGVCRDAMAYVAEQYGRLDALVNNAGMNDGVGLEHGSPERFQQSLQNNLLHVYTLAHHALPLLKVSRGTIVNIASKVAVTGQGNTSGYAAAKGAMLALTREWAAELLSAGIRVNSVLPAEVMTPLYDAWLKTLNDPEGMAEHIAAQVPLGQRFTTPMEIASTVAFLLSPTHAGHITGQQLFVDGGYAHLDRMLTAKPLH